MTDTGPHPLGEVRVVDLTTGLAGPYCTKLFADAGADVVKVEPPGGDPLRRYAATGPVPTGEDGALFRFLGAGKRSVVGRPGEALVDALVAGADLVVEDLPSPSPELDEVASGNPHLVTVSITPFGRTGPLAGAPAGDLVLQAESGAMTFKGDPRREPVLAGGRISELLGGLFAAPGALAALLAARSTGRGAHLDVSLHDVMAVAGSNYTQVLHDVVGRPAVSGPFRTVDTPGIEQAADGLVAFNTNAGHMLQMFLVLVERPDLVDDPTIARLSGRAGMGATRQKIIDDWVGRHDVGEILDAATELRIPVAPVHDGASVLTDPHLVDRGVFVTDPDGFTRPRPPYRIDGATIGVATPAPRLGEHTDTLEPWPARTAAGGPDDRAGPLPLAGVRVLDLTSWWVGAMATHTLALLGADVIHVEGVAYPDGMRLTGSSYARTDDWWEWGHMFAAANTDKRGITLDLGTDRGRQLLGRLIEWADVFVENFAPRVAESWGLDRESVHRINPDVVYQRMPAYGLTGPWRDRPAFAQTIEPMSTMASITGFPDSRPLSKGGLPDPVAGTHGAWAVLVALAHRHRVGHGVFSEAVMIEAALNVCAQPALEYAAYHRVMERRGNRAAHAAPQGVYRAGGDDQWLAISVTDDDQWVALADALGRPELTGDPRWAAAAGRHAHHDELDRVLADWARGQDPQAAARLLRERGVPAAACRDCRLVAEHPQYRSRGLFEPVEHPRLGPIRVPGLPYRMTGVDHWVHRPSPLFGEHTREVLTDLLGLDALEVDALERERVIASRPAGC